MDKIQKTSKKMIKDITKVTSKFTTNNWIYVGILIVSIMIIILTRNIHIIGVFVIISGIHYLVTKDVSSALMSGAIVGILYLLFIRYKLTENMVNKVGEEEDDESDFVDDQESSSSDEESSEEEEMPMTTPQLIISSA